MRYWEFKQVIEALEGERHLRPRLRLHLHRRAGYIGWSMVSSSPVSWESLVLSTVEIMEVAAL